MFPRACLGLAVCGLLMVFVECDGEDPTQDDGGVDGAVSDAWVPDGGPGPDSGPCANDGELGDPCDEDCDCLTTLACRGLPGEQTCSYACDDYDECTGLPLGCASPVCDFTIGACRCACQGGDCGDEVCMAGWCVGCAVDTDCASPMCGSDPGLDTPRCRLDTQECVCGGECGDGVCDDAEAAVDSCPEDCTGPCVDGEVLPYSCNTGEVVTWCTCVTGAWDCDDPTMACQGDTVCAQRGGNCVATAGDCYEGEIAGDAQGCSGATPLCCQMTDCVGPGLQVQPMGIGACCPGLRALSSSAPMQSFDPPPDGMVCFANCWQFTCAPCGDGACQPFFGENPCNCPEDCPLPYALVCTPDTAAEDCGRGFCRQEGTSCHQETPRCEANLCVRDAVDQAGQVCNPVTAACETP